MINQIVDQLVADINQGKYSSNESLPSENRLSKTYAVPRLIVRKAYERLSEMGYIKTFPGIGRFIKNRKIKIGIQLEGQSSFTDKMRRLGYDLETRFIEVKEYMGSLPFIEKLTNKEDKVMKVSRLRIINGEAAAIHTSYVLKSRFPNIEEDIKGIDSLFRYYKQQGYKDYHYKDLVLTAVLPSDYEREILKCPSLVPVIILEAICYESTTNEIIECLKIIYRGDRFIFKF